MRYSYADVDATMIIRIYEIIVFKFLNLIDTENFTHYTFHLHYHFSTKSWLLK